MKIKKLKYSRGTAFNLSKLNFNWKDLKKFPELESCFLNRKTQYFYDNNEKYNFPTLINRNKSPENGNPKLTLSICIPCYDEEWSELSGTLRSLSKNILIQRKKPDNPFELHVTVYIIQDGWNKASDSLKKEIETEWGCPNEKWITDNLYQKVNKCLIIVPKGEIYYPSYDDIDDVGDVNEIESKLKDNNNRGVTFYPIFITKFMNSQKFNSHLLFFSLCYIQKPDMVFLTDAGTIFESDCLYKLVDYLFKKHLKVIGVTAKQKVMSEDVRDQIQNYPSWSKRYKKVNLFFYLIKNFEWWISPAPLQGYEFESSFILQTAMFNLIGALPVLPGPCQLIWWSYLESYKIKNDGVLDMYFRHLNMDLNNSDIVKSNTLLAEDRILSFAMILRTSKLKTIWVNGATFSYEPMMSWTKLLGQRRRWINGTISTYIYYLMYEKGQDEFLMSGVENKSLKILWKIQLYQSFIQILSPAFFSIALFEAVFQINKYYPSFFDKFYILNYYNSPYIITSGYFIFYVTWILTSIIIGKKSEYISSRIYNFSIEIVYRFYSIVNSFISIFIFYNIIAGPNPFYNPVLIFIIITWSVPLFLSSLLSFNSFFSYILYSIPYVFNSIFYISFIPTYAFARIHDLSWGNRDSTNKITNIKKIEYYGKTIQYNSLFIFFNLMIIGLYMFFIYKMGHFDYLYLIIFFILFCPMLLQYFFTFLYFLNELFKKIFKYNSFNDSNASNTSIEDYIIRKEFETRSQLV